MNEHCAPYKKRKHPAIIASSHAFSEAMHKREYDQAAKIVFATTLEVLGVKGLMHALDQGNKYWIRMHEHG